ncbi:MAG: hypothetical protein U9Q33_08275 [Campylobacterota bacterium]|nr:hypothetical protein [Campylobacterota bacterium]
MKSHKIAIAGTGYVGLLLYHRSIEKILKSIVAYENNPITKTHNLIELNEMLEEYFDFNEDELMLLAKITK